MYTGSAQIKPNDFTSAPCAMRGTFDGEPIRLLWPHGAKNRFAIFVDDRLAAPCCRPPLQHAVRVATGDAVLWRIVYPWVASLCTHDNLDAATLSFQEAVTSASGRTGHFIRLSTHCEFSMRVAHGAHVREFV